MSIYFAPAFVALLLKLFVLAYVIRGGRVSLVFLSLIVVFSIHNAIEVLGYFNYQSDVAVSIFFRLYYVATIYVILYMFLHGLSVSKLENRITITAAVLISTVLAGFTLFTDLVVAGQYSIGYTISALEGPYYSIFAIYILISLSCSVFVTLHGYRKAESQIDSVRCLHSMLALAPVTVVCALTMTFKMANIGVTATGLIPIATALFLIIVLQTESKHKLSDLRRIMPLSPERKTTNSLMDLLDTYVQNSNQSNVYKELQAGIEKEIILYSLKKCNGNITNTAKLMGLKNRSTLYSMMNRLEMNLKELKHQAID